MFEAELIEGSLFLWGILYLFIELTGIYFALHAILNTRSSEAAVAWAITLITLPFLVLPVYWLFGSSRFYGYMESFRQAKLEHVDTAKKSFREVEQFHVNEIEGLQTVVNTIKNLHTLPFTSHNSANLLINGTETYKAMLNAIKQAQDYVLLQFYIIHNDHVGETFRQVLTQKLEQGIRVYFLYDEIGSHRLSFQYIRQLRKAGAQVSSFNGHRGINKYLHINFRNHRKILIVDGKKAFVGGLNLGQEYLGEDKEIGYWRDTHVLLQGPAVQCTQGVFIRDWYWSQGEVPELNWLVQSTQEMCHFDDYGHNEKTENASKCNQNILILGTGPASEKPVCSLFITALINQAQSRLWVATPYFVPDAELIQALKNAALRGVDVRLILPEKNDNYFVYLTSFAYYQELRGYDIKIYRYTKGFSHQKVILVDDKLTGIGTVNLDNRSIHLNFEIAAYIADRDFTLQVQKMLEYDLQYCYLDNIEEFEQRSFWFRAISRLLYLFSPIL